MWGLDVGKVSVISSDLTFLVKYVVSRGYRSTRPYLGVQGFCVLGIHLSFFITQILQRVFAATELMNHLDHVYRGLWLGIAGTFVRNKRLVALSFPV